MQTIPNVFLSALNYMYLPNLRCRSTSDYRDIGSRCDPSHSNNTERLRRTNAITTTRNNERRQERATSRTARDGRRPGWWCSHHPACRYTFSSFSLSTTNVVDLIQVSRVATRSLLVLVLCFSSCSSRLCLVSVLSRRLLVWSRSCLLAPRLVSFSDVEHLLSMPTRSRTTLARPRTCPYAITRSQCPDTSHLPGATSIYVRVSNAR